MKFVLIRDNPSLDDIDEAIGNLRAKQRKAVISSTRDEIGDDINELLEMRSKAPA